MQSMTLEAPRVNSAGTLEAAPEIPAANPRDSWPAWTDADRWELGPDPAPPGPARSDPSAEDEAYASGFYLAFHHGLSVAPPSGWRLMRSSAFRLGQADGLLERHRREDEAREEQLLEQERMLEAFGGPARDWHPDEAVRAVGCIAARSVAVGRVSQS